MTGTLRCSDLFFLVLLPQIMGLGLVLSFIISHHASTIGLLVFVSSFFLYHSGHYASAGAMAIDRVICHDPHEYKQSMRYQCRLSEYPVVASWRIVVLFIRVASRLFLVEYQSPVLLEALCYACFYNAMHFGFLGIV